MHPSVMKYVEAVVRTRNFPDYWKVLEVGSYNVNGSVRPLFGANYTGMDIRKGPGVDIVVEEGWEWPFTCEEFEIVVSTEMLEHDLRPWKSLAEMERVLKEGGYLILTARGYDIRGCFPIHEYPGDFWRYTVDGMRALIEAAGLNVIDCRPDPEAPGVFATAVKP